MHSDKFLKLLEIINQVPTADNCQPFSYTINNNVLSVGYDPVIAAHPLNKDEVATYITIGILLKYIKLTCHALGIHPEINLNIIKLNKKSIILTCLLTEDTDDNEVLYSIDDLLYRYTDRNNFKENKPKERESISEFISSRGDSANVKSYYCRKASNRFLSFVAKNDLLLFSWSETFSKLLEWVRFSKRDIAETKDGLDYRNLGCQYFETRLLKLLWHSPFLRALFIKLKLYASAYLKQFFVLRNSKEFLLITSKGKTLDSLVESGELICETWIYLNKIGVSTQPMNASALLFWRRLALGDTNSLSGNAEKRVSLFLQRYAAEFSLEESEYPVFLFRIGRANAFPREHRSLRKKSNCCLKLKSDIPIVEIQAM